HERRRVPRHCEPCEAGTVPVRSVHSHWRSQWHASDTVSYVPSPPRKTTRRRARSSSRRRGSLPTRTGRASGPRLSWSAQRTLQQPYANRSLITRPLLAIFIGRPVLLVNTVNSEMPSALQMLAITSWLV